MHQEREIGFQSVLLFHCDLLSELFQKCIEFETKIVVAKVEMFFFLKKKKVF